MGGVSQPHVPLTTASEDEAVTLQEVEALAASFAAAHGFASFLLSIRFKLGGDAAVPRAITNADARFVDSYQRNGWGAVDQLMDRSYSSPKPFAYRRDDIIQPRNEWSTAMAMFGLDTGHVIPLHCPEGDGMVLVLTGSRSGELQDSERERLYYESWIFLCNLYRPLRKILGANASAVLNEQVASLSEREHKVLTLLTHGKQIKRIACTLGVHSKTINNDILSICDKLRVVNRTEAIVKYSRAGKTTVLRAGEADPLMLMVGI